MNHQKIVLRWVSIVVIIFWFAFALWKQTHYDYTITGASLVVEFEDSTTSLSGQRWQTNHTIERSPILQHSGFNPRSWQITIAINTETQMLDQFIIDEIHAAPTLDDGYKVFIEDVVLERRGENLLSGELQSSYIIEKTPTLFWSDVIITMTWSDSHNYTQEFRLALQSYCPPRLLKKIQRTCTLSGTYRITTPLVSGNIIGNIQGKLFTSILQ